MTAGGSIANKSQEPTRLFRQNSDGVFDLSKHKEQARLNSKATKSRLILKLTSAGGKRNFPSAEFVYPLTERTGFNNTNPMNELTDSSQGLACLENNAPGEGQGTAKTDLEAIFDRIQKNSLDVLKSSPQLLTSPSKQSTRTLQQHQQQGLRSAKENSLHEENQNLKVRLQLVQQQNKELRLQVARLKHDLDRRSPRKPERAPDIDYQTPQELQSRSSTIEKLRVEPLFAGVRRSLEFGGKRSQGSDAAREAEVLRTAAQSHLFRQKESNLPESLRLHSSKSVPQTDLLQIKRDLEAISSTVAKSEETEELKSQLKALCESIILLLGKRGPPPRLFESLCSN